MFSFCLIYFVSDRKQRNKKRSILKQILSPMRQSEKKYTCKPIHSNYGPSRKSSKYPAKDRTRRLRNRLYTMQWYLGVPGQIVMFWLFVEQKTDNKFLIYRASYDFKNCRVIEAEASHLSLRAWTVICTFRIGYKTSSRKGLNEFFVGQLKEMDEITRP